MRLKVTHFILRNILAGALLLLGQNVVFAQGVGTLDSRSAQKLAPGLRSKKGHGSIPSVRVLVKNEAAFQKWLAAEMPTTQQNSDGAAKNLVLLSRVTTPQLEKLAQCPWVTFIDTGHRNANEEAYLQNSDLRVNRVEALHLAYPALHGKGLVVSIKEQPFDSTDIDFKTRVVPSYAFQNVATPHATSMATLIAGGGNSAPTGQGVAWQSQMTASNFSNLLPDQLEGLQAQKVTVQNHSYGVGVENYYGLESQAYDQQTLQDPVLLHVFSSGNAGTQALEEGPYANLNGFANLTGQFKISKNTISVGAIDTSGQVSILSSRGPTYDGRIKPELVAFGEAGTSEAASVVSGISLLVQHAYQQQNGGALPPSSLVKAALINAADDKGRPEVDYAAGFGNADGLGAVQSIVERRYAHLAVTQGNTQTLRFTVPAGMAKVKVTLVWQDLEGSPESPKALVNDLDLVLQSGTSGEKWLPWGLSTVAHKDSLLAPARRKEDHLNNVEQITLVMPTPGDYDVQVTGFQVQGSQSFSVVYEFEKAFSWAYPTAGSHIESGLKNRLRWLMANKEESSGRLEFKWASAGAQWQTIQDNVLLSAEALDVMFKDTTALAEIRMVVGNEVYGSGQVMISPTLSLKVGYNCGEEVMLYWPKAEGAEAYQVYQLGAQFLEPAAAQTSDTVFVFNKSQHPALHYAVAPVVNGKIGQRSLTRNYSQQAIGCYIKQFLPHLFVTDTVLLDLEISTTYGLQALYLEKKTDGVFKTVQPIALGLQKSFVLQDHSPVSGWNEYRVKLVTKAGATFYSPTEGLFYAPATFIQVYPNPGMAGADINIITQDDNLNTVFIFDAMGRLIRETTQSGSIKVIETLGLPPGAYFIKVISSTGTLTQTKVILL